MRRISFFVVICLVAVPYSCKSKAREARISFVGDIIMHIPVKNCARSRALPEVDRAPSSNNMGFDHLFERIRDDLEGSDIVVGNMEFPVSPPYVSKPRIFNCRPEVLPAMKKAGFTMMHLANNHILDQGEGGVTGTMSHVRESGMDYVGVGENEDITRAGLVKTIHGIRIGFIGYTGLTNYSRPRNPTGCHINWFYDREKVLADIRAIKSRVDYLVMIVHNGVEYANIPAPNDVRLIKNYIESGVDLVIGHHSHILQPVERIVARDGRVCFIFYSLGNFLSNQNPSPSINIHGFPLTPRDSAVINCILRSSGPDGRPEALFEVVPVHTVNTRDRESGLRIIQTVAIHRDIESLKKGLSDSVGKEKVDIERRMQNLYQKLNTIRRALFSNNVFEEIRFIHGIGGHER